VVLAGPAMTTAPVVAFNPVAGDHEYDAAPLPVRVTVSMPQILFEEGVMEVTGNGFTRIN